MLYEIYFVWCIDSDADNSIEVNTDGIANES